MGTHSLFLESGALSFEAIIIAVEYPGGKMMCLVETAIAQLV